uniref:Ig-like domain-containing protein n=1 Tax=Echeneis naucrates TaxID=173247 RepID=A0A665T6K6_ECHNA
MWDDSGHLRSTSDLWRSALGQTVNYPPPVCAVTGSTITLPCTFKPLQSVIVDGGELQLNVLRVLWCQDHPICQKTTPSVVDSSNQTNLPIDPRYSYLGDKTGNCSLQIRNLKDKDQGKFRFRMEMNNDRGHFTGKKGVIVTVVDTSPLRIILSGGDGVMSEGQSVKLLCSSNCSINQLELMWFRDGHTLSESGPALQFHHLTAEDSGNYTCGLKRDLKARSEPHQLQVEPVRTGGMMSLQLLSIPVVLCVSALMVFIIIRSFNSSDYFYSDYPVLL